MGSLKSNMCFFYLIDMFVVLFQFVTDSVKMLSLSREVLLDYDTAEQLSLNLTCCRQKSLFVLFLKILSL